MLMIIPFNLLCGYLNSSYCTFNQLSFVVSLIHMPSLPIILSTLHIEFLIFRTNMLILFFLQSRPIYERSYVHEFIIVLGIRPNLPLRQAVVVEIWICLPVDRVWRQLRLVHEFKRSLSIDRSWLIEMPINHRLRVCA